MADESYILFRARDSAVGAGVACLKDVCMIIKEIKLTNLLI